MNFDDYLFGWNWDSFHPDPSFARIIRSEQIGFCDYNYWDRPDDFTGEHKRSFFYRNGGTGMMVGNRQAGGDFLGPTQIYMTKAGLPVPKMGTSEKKATIIEVLKVWFYNKIDNSAANSSLTMCLTTRGLGDPDEWEMINDPGTIAAVRINYHFTGSTDTGAVATTRIYPIEVDLTDGAGHGVLVATDSIFGFLLSSSTGETNVGAIRFLYRYKQVDVLEYVGIVQSQQ